MRNYIKTSVGMIILIIVTLLPVDSFAGEKKKETINPTIVLSDYVVGKTPGKEPLNFSFDGGFEIVEKKPVLREFDFTAAVRVNSISNPLWITVERGRDGTIELRLSWIVEENGRKTEFTVGDYGILGTPAYISVYTESEKGVKTTVPVDKAEILKLYHQMINEAVHYFKGSTFL